MENKLRKGEISQKVFEEWYDANKPTSGNIVVKKNTFNKLDLNQITWLHQIIP